MNFRKWLKLWWFNLRYNRYDTRIIEGIEVHTYWKLDKCVPGSGFLCIPLRLKREGESEQILLVLTEFRKAVALRILSKRTLK